MSTAAVYVNYTCPCACGITRATINGVEQPHNCQPTAQDVRDAWAEGYEFGKREANQS